MEDRKMDLFVQKELWEHNIQKCVNKGIDPNLLRPYTDGFIRSLLIAAISNNEYRVAPPHIACIPKDNGKIRKVFVNTPLDRLILGCVNDVYCQLYGSRIHPRCLSYQKGISVHSIIQKVCAELSNQSSDRIAGYKVDIHAYFDSVSRSVVNRALQELNTGSVLDMILYDYYNQDLVIDENGEVIEHYKSLAQGCAFGTFLANYVLRDVDDVLSSIVPIYYRYSDDILIIGDEKDRALDTLQKMLSEKGLTLNPAKVEPVYANKWFTFLGFKIKGSQVGFSAKSLKKLCKEIECLTINRVGREKKSYSEKEIKKVIDQITNQLYLSYEMDHRQFGWAEYFFNTVNLFKDIQTIDFWIRDCICSMYTGKTKVGGLGSVELKDSTVMRGTGKNVSANKKKTHGLLERNGYFSMSHLYKLYHIDKAVYRQYLRGGNE